MLRYSLHAVSGCLIGKTFWPQAGAAVTTKRPRWPIGACDWSLGKQADVEALRVASELGLDGVQVSLGTAADNMHLRRPAVQREYQEAVARYGVAVSSLALGELNRIPYKEDPRTIAWVQDSPAAARALNCRVVLLAFFGKGDLKNDPQGTREVIRRLKMAAPYAERHGVIFGIESWLSAEEHLRILEAVGSPAVQVYYDVANSTKMGYPIYDELRTLGKQGLLCEVHCKENGALLGQGKVDFPRVHKILHEVNYHGWLVIEGAVPPGQSRFQSYQANLKYLRNLFSSSPAQQ